MSFWIVARLLNLDMGSVDQVTLYSDGSSGAYVNDGK